MTSAVSVDTRYALHKEADVPKTGHDIRHKQPILASLKTVYRFSLIQ
jgi:hypothetical protein